jgi:AraC family transcriptional regulator
VERTEVSRNGAHAVKAAVGGFDLQRLRFPAAHTIPWFEPSSGYIAVVLDGALEKRFTGSAWSLARDSLATLPEGAAHSTEFGARPTNVLTISPRRSEDGILFTRFLRDRRQLSAPAAAALGRRVADELDVPDRSSELAAEGLVLQLLALGERERGRSRHDGSAWLATVLEVLREQTPRVPTLGELAAEAGVHPGHLARTFRRAFGTTVGDYSRSLRLEWAAARLSGDGSLAEIAIEAGYADQSHFTRTFRRSTGMTPGRYRELLRR